MAMPKATKQVRHQVEPPGLSLFDLVEQVVFYWRANPPVNDEGRDLLRLLTRFVEEL